MWIFTRQKNPIVVKTCFSEEKLMKQFGNPPLSKRTAPSHQTPYFWAIFSWSPSLSKFQKQESPLPLILAGRKLWKVIERERDEALTISCRACLLFYFYFFFFWCQKKEIGFKISIYFQPLIIEFFWFT